MTVQGPSKVELVYVPTKAEVTEVVRVRLRHSPMGRLLRWLLPTGGVLAALVVVWELAGPGAPELSKVFLFGGLGALVLTLGPLIPRVTGSQMYGLVEPQGEFRAVVDDDGVTWTTRVSETTSRWAMLPLYVETPTLFVLLSADRAGVGVAALPKQGVSAPEDLDRLRAILERHVKRV
ncbi:YcxB family protein [Streptomyces sp. NPDC013457]|uniref:YcxB family protein n=1 Tax=Streptomyces sp. NPDC013457 TaxID=3364866 RepID=UPI0036FEE608